MQHFSLFARGDCVDVDSFLQTTTLTFDRAWRRGEKLRPTESADSYVDSGFEKLLGDGANIPFIEQQEIAIEFITQNRDAIRGLARHDGVELCSLRLQYQLELGTNTVGFLVEVFPELNWHALDVGIEISTMVVLERDLGWTKFPFNKTPRSEA